MLTDDDAGRRALQDWIVELIDLSAEHQGTFLLWAQVQFSEPSLAAIGQRQLTRYQSAVVERLAAAGARPPTPAIVPVGILSVVQWSYFLFVARHPAIPRATRARRSPSSCTRYLFAPPDRRPRELDRAPMPTGSPARDPARRRDGPAPAGDRARASAPCSASCWRPPNVSGQPVTTERA